MAKSANSCYRAGGWRLYGGDKHGSTGALPSARVCPTSPLSLLPDSLLYTTGTPSPSEQSGILCKKRLSNIVSTCSSLQRPRLTLFPALNSKERVYFADASSDPRFSAEATQTLHRSVICLPIFSNRGQTFGAVYVSSKYPFSQNTVTILTLFCQQASISISNALLFRSVQAGTRENLKMIATQREALEAARKSREDALKATKVRPLSRDRVLSRILTAGT